MPEMPKLEQLAEQWQEIFGEPLVLGMVVTDEQLPIVERCIKLRDQGPLERHVEDLLESGIIL